MKLFLHAFKRFQTLKFIKYLLFGLYDGGDKKLKSERKLKHIKLWCTLLGHRFLLLASLRFYQSFFNIRFCYRKAASENLANIIQKGRKTTESFSIFYHLISHSTF